MGQTGEGISYDITRVRCPVRDLYTFQSINDPLAHTDND